MLPTLSIEFDNGNIGAVSPSEDSLFGVIATISDAPEFPINTPIEVSNMIDVVKKGITERIQTNRLYKFLKEYYAEAGEGNRIWIMGIDKNISAALFTPDPTTGEAPAELLLNSANGKIRALFTVNQNTGAVLGDNPFIPVISAAHTFAVNYTQKKYAPLFIVNEAFGWDNLATSLPDLTTMTNNRSGVIVGDTVKSVEGSAIGLLAGRLAKNQVHQNIGKPKDGPVSSLSIFVQDKKAELADVEAIHNKGYITFRTHTNKSGYFFTHNLLATEIDDDYRHITRRRVIDKAYRLTYDVLVDELLDEVPVTRQGTISEIYAKTIEGAIVNRIYTQMTLNGELAIDASDSNDKGVIAKIDTTSNFLANGTMQTVIKVRPFGYNDFIKVQLGFDTVNN